MKRFASTRSEQRDSQPLPGPRAVQRRLHRGRRDPVRVDDVRLDREHDRDRAQDRDRPVDGDPPLAREAVRQEVDRVSQDAVLARLCSRRHSSILPWSPESRHLRHGPATELGRPGVVRVLEAAVELRREALLDGRLLAPERPGQPARDRVDQRPSPAARRRTARTARSRPPRSRGARRRARRSPRTGPRGASDAFLRRALRPAPGRAGVPGGVRAITRWPGPSP